VKYAGDDIAGTIGLTFCKRWAPKAQNCQCFKAFLQRFWHFCIFSFSLKALVPFLELGAFEFAKVS
jgi:hypothetical protein